MKELQGLSNARILIVRGRGGSETLKDNLSSSNQVDYFEVYERVPCELTMKHEESLKLFLSKPDGILMVTSKESLDSILYLVQSISSNFVEIIKTKKIIVFSERLKVLVKDFGFKNIHVTANPSDEDLVNLLVNIK